MIAVKLEELEQRVLAEKQGEAVSSELGELRACF